jgi:hypothetical protein
MYAFTTFDRTSPSAFLTAYARKQDIEILFAASDPVTLASRMPKRVVEMNKHPIPDDCLHLILHGDAVAYLPCPSALPTPWESTPGRACYSANSK